MGLTDRTISMRLSEGLDAHPPTHTVAHMPSLPPAPAVDPDLGSVFSSSAFPTLFSQHTDVLSALPLLPT